MEPAALIGRASGHRLDFFAVIVVHAKARSREVLIDQLEPTWSQVTVQMERGIHHHGGKFFNIRLKGGLLIFASLAPSREPGLDRFVLQFCDYP